MDTKNRWLKEKVHILKKVTPKWWHDWYVIFRMKEAGKTHRAFSYFKKILLLCEIKFIHIMLHHGLFTWKRNCYCSFTDVLIAVATNIHDKVSFNRECLRTFFFFNNIYNFWSTINPLHPNISMHILHTVLNTFCYVLAGRICLTIKRFFSLLLLPLFS